MRQFPYASFVLTIVLSALISTTGTILYQAYKGSQQALEEEIQFTYDHDAALLQRMVDEHLKHASLMTQDLAARHDIRASMLADDHMTASMLLTSDLYNSPQKQMDALALQAGGQTTLVIQDTALESLRDAILEHLPRHETALDQQTLITLNVENKQYHFIRVQSPVISPVLGEVLGEVYAFILLNENFTLLSDAVEITGATAITLHNQQQLVSWLDTQHADLSPLLEQPPTQAIMAISEGTKQWHNIEIAGSMFAFSLIKLGKSLNTLSETYNHSLRNGIFLAIAIALIAMLCIRYLTNRALSRLTAYAEQAPLQASPPAFELDRFVEFNQLGTQIERMLRDIREQENQLDAIFHNTPSAMFLKGGDLSYLMVNSRYMDLFSHQGASVIGKNDYDIFPEAEARHIREVDLRVISTQKTLQSEYSLTTAQGRRHFLSTKFPILNDQGELYAIGGINTDITDNVAAQEEAAITQQVFDSAAEAILIYNPNGRVITNASFERITGFDGKRARLFALNIIKDHPEIDIALAKAGRWQGESVRRKANGEPLPIWLSISTIQTSTEAEKSYIAVFSDISELKEAERKLEKLAHFDNLTNLPNRTLFYDRIESSLARSSRNGKKTALLFVDIDRFKQVNDHYGHHAGDQMLIEVARRISTHMPVGDTVARLGGDEFTVILSELDGIAPVQDIARQIQTSLRLPYSLDNHEIISSASIGIAIYPDDGGDAEALLKHADVAMYHAKEGGRNDIVFFDKALNAQAEVRAQLEDNLKVAINTGEFFLNYQPRFNITGDRVLSAEALIRWQHPEQGLIPPGQFIPLAESSGLIIELGRWVLQQACLAAQQWNRIATTPVPVSVNLSARQLHDPDLLEDIQQALLDSGLTPALLELEITETMIIQDMDLVIERLDAIRAMGVNLSVDDFGTGYSSLVYLKRLPVSTVKIDKSFIDDVPGESDSENLVKAVISMSHSLNLNVVAEGVETPGQLNFLTTNRCNEIQGFLLAKPESSADLRQRLKTIKSSYNTKEPAIV